MSENDHLRATYTAEDAHHGRLDVFARINGFSGRGSAYFNSEDVREFAAALSVVPLPPVSLVGGTGRGSDGTFPQTITVGLWAEIANAKGDPVVRVELAECDGASLHQRAALNIPVTYNALVTFSYALRRTLDEPAFEAKLEVGS